ncbi:MAG TPA: hypothetical protein VGO57_13815 [Verrucomicrobiae bacterium]
MKISTLLAGELEPRGAWFRYSMLTIAFVLLMIGLQDDLLGHSGNQKHLVVFIPFLLLINHLAFNFRWPRGLTIFLRASAMLWLLVVTIYIFTR